MANVVVGGVVVSLVVAVLWLVGYLIIPKRNMFDHAFEYHIWRVIMGFIIALVTTFTWVICEIVGHNIRNLHAVQDVLEKP